jgi:hypothetical protein
VRDPLFVRALAVRGDGEPVVVLAFDLLMVTDELHRGLAARLAPARVIVHATHSHSSLGGEWPALLGRYFLGRYRPWAIPRLVDAGERAAREALASTGPATVRSASLPLPGLNGNRRDPAGPKDEELTVLRLSREDGDAIVASYPAHPVIVAERDHIAASADFPGEIVRLLERDTAFGMYLQGALGAVDVLFPDDKALSADRNLAMMAEPIAASALAMARSAPPSEPVVAFAAAQRTLPRPDPLTHFEDDPWRLRLDRVLAPALGLLVASLPRVARVRGLRIGDWAVAGAPADLGVGLALDAKAAARAAGVRDPVVASQCDGYVGYVHRRQDYAHTPPASHREMAFYENAMNFFGRGTGDVLAGALDEVLKTLCRKGRP